MGIEFTVRVADVDEAIDGEAKEIVRVLARRKARAVAETLTHGIVLAADTLVALLGVSLGKPTDERDAYRMLKSLSGAGHDVYTGICLIDAETGQTADHVERTGVRFRPLTDAEIEDYIATGEPMDKAGAYGIQGRAGRFVEAIDGSFENVMGLPVQALKRLLAEFLAERIYTARATRE